MLRQSIHLMTILLFVQFSNNLKAQLPDTSGNSGPCSLACLDHLTVSLDSEGRAQIWAEDFLISDCTRPYTLTVTDSDDSIIFQQLEDDNFWSLTSEDQNKTYLYTVEHNETGNKCWGNITIDDKIGANGSEEVSQNGQTHNNGISQQTEAASCAGFPIDFSTFQIEASVEFDNRTFADVHNELTQSYTDAFDLMITENGLDPESNDYLAGWHLEDEILKEGSDLIEIERTIAIIDFCEFDPVNRDKGIIEVKQHILIRNVASVVISDISYAGSSANIGVSKISLVNENGQETPLNLDTDQSISNSIQQTFDAAGWEEGAYQIEVDKFESCVSNVSSIDLIQVLQHIIGSKVLDTNVKKAAADFDENGKVTAADLVSMRSIILGLSDCENDSHWRFYKDELSNDKNFVVSNISDYSLAYHSSQPDETKIDIIALKKGDVDFSSADKKSLKTKYSTLHTENQYLKADKEYTIDFISPEDITYISGDFIFNQNDDFNIIGFQSKEVDITNQNYNITDTDTKMIWYEDEIKHIEKENTLFSMTIRANKNGQLRDILKSTNLDIQLYQSNTSRAPITYQLSVQDIPFHTSLENEFSASLIEGRFKVNATENSNTKIMSVEIFNMTGTKLYSHTNINQAEFITDLNTHTSILVYRIVTEHGQVQTGKIVTL